MTFADAYDPIRALTSSWRLLLRSPFPLFVAGALLTLLGDGPDVGIIQDWDHLRGDELIGAVCTLGLCCGIPVLLLNAWLSLGLAHATEKTLVDGSARFEDVFVSKGRFFDMVLLRVLRCLILILAAIPFFVVLLVAALIASNRHFEPGLIWLGAVLSWLVYMPFYWYVALGFSLAVQAVAIEGLKPTEALRRSWSLAEGNRLRLLVYWLALWVFTLIGFCCCCVGVFMTGALAQVATNESYLQFVKPISPIVPPSPPSSPRTETSTATDSTEPPILPS